LVSAAAAANPAEEHRLVELAGRVSLAELREECVRVKAAADPDPEATNRRLHAGRRLRRYVDSEGFWNLHARGTPQAGAGLTTVLDPIIDRIFTNARAQGRRESPDAYAFDALSHLAAHAAGHCNCQTSHAAADPADPAHPGTAHAHRSAVPVGDRCAGEGTAGLAAPSGARVCLVWAQGSRWSHSTRARWQPCTAQVGFIHSSAAFWAAVGPRGRTLVVDRQHDELRMRGRCVGRRSKGSRWGFVHERRPCQRELPEQIGEIGARPDRHDLNDAH
jgi:Domain of unknown function (DUF222)